MKPLYKQFVVFSTYTDSTTESTTHHKLVLQELKQLNISHLEVNGCYKGTTEKSILVLVDDKSDIYNVIEYARLYNQESVLVRNSDNTVELLTLSTMQSKHIGQWKEVSKEAALKCDAYTEYDNRYFICK